jgi:hypothetical protein
MPGGFDSGGFDQGAFSPSAFQFEGEAPDATPDAFSFVDQFAAPLNTAIESAPIVVSGIDSTAPITVSNGTYSINGGGFTSSAGTVANGDEVQAGHTSSGSYSTTVSTIVTIGGVSDTFSSLTAADPEAAIGSHAYPVNPGGVGRMMGRA